MQAAVTDRECGPCEQCCKVVGVTELEKPPGTWCDHATKGKGCAIYHERPATCRAFSCLWLGGFLEEQDRPDRSRVVLATTRAEPYATAHGFAMPEQGLVVTVFEQYHGAADKPRVKRVIASLVQDGIPVVIMRPPKSTLLIPKSLQGSPS